jgi:methionyl-tRNA formyltransferase
MREGDRGGSIVYISSLQSGKECLRLVKDKIRIDHVVTIDPRMAERAAVSGYADFADTGIHVCHVGQYSMKSPGDFELIRSLAPRLIIVNGWNRLIPRAILDLPRVGCVGIHGSWKRLPFGRGRSPITWALVKGEQRFFVHLFYLDEGVDSGDVIDTVQFDITPYDTCATVHAKVGIVSARLLITNVSKILDGTAQRTAQAGEPTYLPKRTSEGGLIDWTMRMEEICNLVRAVTRPYGGAFTDIEYQGRRVTMYIWDAVPFSYEIEFDGTVGAIVHGLDGKLLIRCRDGTMLVKDFTVAGSA